MKLFQDNPNLFNIWKPSFTILNNNDKLPFLFFRKEKRKR